MMRILLNILTILSYSTVFGQISLTTTKIKHLDSIATQDVPPKAPGIATAIIQNGQVIYEKYTGFANFSDSTLISSKSRFNIASNGKQFTALAILTLIYERKLKLTDDLRKWFPSLYPNIKDKISIQSLLNHTSGIRDCYDLWSLQGLTWWEHSFDNQDVLALIEKQTDLNFRPDTKYLYSNSNYILLALIIEKISGKTFVEYTNEMFKQLNMSNTSFEHDFKSIRKPVAKAYFNFNTWTTYDWIWNVCGDGNIFSPLEDQIQWEKLVQGKGISKIKRETILKSQEIIKHSTFSNYGYGLEFGKYKDMEYSFHEGATGAWKASVIRFPKSHVSIVTLTNTGKAIPYNQTRQMADVLFELKSDTTYIITKPSSIGNYISENEIVGTYLTEKDFAFTFEKKNNSIFLKRVGRNDVELEREADNIFHQKYDPAFKQEFIIDSKGKMQVTVYYVNHSPYSLTKVAILGNKFNFNKIEGEYFNSETNSTITIKHLDGINYEVRFRTDYITKGLLIANNKILVDFFSLEFRREDLFLNGERIKQVKYLRK